MSENEKEKCMLCLYNIHSEIAPKLFLLYIALEPALNYLLFFTFYYFLYFLMYSVIVFVNFLFLFK